jgi:crossover junction endodeoxyribonuclease RuvC
VTPTASKNGETRDLPNAARERIVLGIDPGTRCVGFGAVGDGPRGPMLLGAGVIMAPARAHIATRLAAIRSALDRILADLQPGVVVIEEAFVSRSVQSALRIGEGRGVVLACAAACGARVEQMPPAVAKKAIVGFGAADKTQVAAMVARMLGLDEAPQPLDASDALALALTHIVRRRSVLAR